MGKENKKGLEFSTKYRFMSGEMKTAVLDPDGRLTVLEGSSQEVWASWKDYVKKIMDETPATEGEQDALDQLGMMLGTATPCDVAVNVTEKAEKKQKEKAVKSEEKDDDMATKKAAVKKTVKKDKAPKELKRCICGASDCKAMTTGNFAPGHDARVHGWGVKIKYGEMKFNEIGAEAQKYLRDHGIKFNSETRPEKPAKKK